MYFYRRIKAPFWRTSAEAECACSGLHRKACRDFYRRHVCPIPYCFAGAHVGLAPTPSKMADKVGLYEAFVDEKLKKDLEKVHRARDEAYSKMAEYLQLKNSIEQIQATTKGGLRTKVDLGCNFYCQAKIEDSSKICVAVGYGFFVEFTLDEAKAFIEKKCDQLSKYVEKLGRDSAKIKAHIKLVLEGLRELQGITQPHEEPRPVW